MLRAVEVWGPLAALLIGFVLLAWLGARAGRQDRHAGWSQPVEHEHIGHVPADPLSSASLPQRHVSKEERERAAVSHEGGGGRYRQDADDGEPSPGNVINEEIVINTATAVLLVAAAFFGEYLARSPDETRATKEERRFVLKT